MNRSFQQVVAEAQALDRRRQKQIANQVETINRLLSGGTYEGELQTLHEQLAEAQAELEELRDGR